MAMWRRMANLFRRERVDREIREELEAHIAMRTEENEARGMSPEEARREARVRFGNATAMRERVAAADAVLTVEGVVRDLRLAARQLRRSPGFAITAFLTLALGIGAVTAVFSVVDAVLLKPFAFRDPDRLVVLREAIEDPQTGRTASPDNYRHVMRLKATAKTIEDVAVFEQNGTSVSTSGDHPRIVGTVIASPNIFRLLGVQPMLGRGFADGDARQGATPVVVLSYAGWQAFFGGSPDAVGQTLRIDGHPATIIGVLPAGMRFPQIALAPKIAFQETTRGALLFEPLTPSERDLTADMGNFNYKTIARLKPGVTLAQARAELEGLQNSYTISAHLPLHFGIALTPLKQDVGSPVSGALWLLFAAVGAVLLIACVNLASLQLARAIQAQREVAVRAALGASKGNLLRPRLAESLLLVVLGGAGGTAIAFGGVRLLLAVVPASVPRLNDVRVNLPVLLFAAGVSVFAAIAFGLLPALQSLRVPPQAALQSNSIRMANSQESYRTRSILVAGQVACTVVLLIVAALSLRSFGHLLRQNRGFDASHVTLAQVDLFTPRYDVSGTSGNAIRVAFTDRVLTALGQLPGVQAVAVTSVAPLTGENWVDSLQRPDHPVPEGKEPPINVRWIDPEYLPTMGSRLVEGRNFAAADRANPFVALISHRAAREGFPDEDPVGHKIANLVPDDPRPITVIGVVADARVNGLKDTAAMVYMPYWAFAPLSESFLVRSSRDSEGITPEMREAIWRIDPQVAIPTVKSMDEQVNESVATDRFQAVVLTNFGAAALLLALLGIYGVLAYAVSLRRQEFGIRIALGSGKDALVGLVLRQAAMPVLLGTGTGLMLAFVALRWVGSLLYQTPVLDPVAIGVSAGLVVITATAAAVLPARRAALTNPVQVLRSE